MYAYYVLLGVYGYKLDSSPAGFGSQTPGCTLYNQIPTTAELKTLMIDTNTKTAWLNLKRINLEHWYWLDGVFYGMLCSHCLFVTYCCKCQAVQ